MATRVCGKMIPDNLGNAAKIYTEPENAKIYSLPLACEDPKLRCS